MTPVRCAPDIRLFFFVWKSLPQHARTAYCSRFHSNDLWIRASAAAFVRMSRLVFRSAHGDAKSLTHAVPRLVTHLHMSVESRFLSGTARTGAMPGESTSEALLPRGPAGADIHARRLKTGPKKRPN